MNFKKKIKKYLDQPVIFAVVLVVIIVLVAAILAQGKKVSPGGVLANEQKNGGQNADSSMLEHGESDSGSVEYAASMEESEEHIMALKKVNGVAVPAGNRVKYKIGSFQKLAAQPLKFNIYDDKGAEITPDWLVTEHEQKMHFILATASLKDYQHLHPAYKNGVWNVNANMPTPGTYYAYVNIVPVKGSPVVLRSDLTVREPTKGEIKYPGLTPELFALTDGYKVQLEVKGANASDEKLLTFTVTRDGKPVTDIKPYLGAFGHVILLRHGNPDTFVHLHPYLTTDETKGQLAFAAYVNDPGRYTAFAEFKIGDKVRLFPLTFDVD